MKTKYNIFMYQRIIIVPHRFILKEYVSDFQNCIHGTLSEQSIDI